MASTVTFNGNSPHSLTLTIVGTAGATTVSRSTVLAACAEGPLKALLTRTVNWTVFNMVQPLDVREILNRVSAVDPTTFQFAFLPTTGIQVDCDGTMQLEIRLPHTSRS